MSELTAEIYDDDEPSPESEIHLKEEPLYRSEIRSLVRSIYDLQKIRISQGNRIFILWCRKNNIDFKDKDNKAKADKKLEEYRTAYDLITNNLKTDLFKCIKKLVIPPDQIITTTIELIMVEGYNEIYEREKKQFAYLEKVLDSVDIYTKYLKKIKGIGPAMAGVLISEINIYKSKYSSSIHKYAGIDVVIEDGKARSKRAEHLIDVEYVNKEGKIATRKSITYNPFLQSKLLSIMAEGLIKSNSPKYKLVVYNNYKHRLNNREDLKDHSDMHKHRMTIRYMMKIFLMDLYDNWRPMEGLAVHKPYHEVVLGHVHNEDRDGPIVNPF